MTSRGTTIRSIRISDALWNAAQDKAARRGTTVSDIVVKSLRTFTDAPEAVRPAIEPVSIPAQYLEVLLRLARGWNDLEDPRYALTKGEAEIVRRAERALTSPQ